MPTIEFAREQQRQIEKYWRAGGDDFGALIGWLDWETEIRIMTWGWHKIDENNYRFDDVWSVQLDWGSGKWYALRSGKYCLAGFADAGGAMNEADLRREADKLYVAPR